MQRLMLECAVRAALIALATAGILRVLRVKSAGARHAAWAGVLALMLVLPLWMAWGPRTSLRVLPPAAPVTAVAIPMVAHAHAAIPAVFATPPAIRPAPWNWLLLIYLASVVVLLARLALGTLRAHALVRRAECREGRLTSARCAAPVTVGFLRPAVILPEGWHTWPAAQLDAVLAHEGEHVRRRDPLVEWLALLNRAIFWFHPLAWWLERRLSALAEEACDAAVLERGHDPLEYSGYLLELARLVGRSGVRVNVVGMAMPGSSLPARIRQIVTGVRAPRVTRSRALCLAVVCATVSVMFAAATVDRQPSVPEPPLPPAPPSAPAPASAPLPPTPPAQPPTPPTPPAPTAGKRLSVLFFDVAGMTEDSLARAIAAASQTISRMSSNDQMAIMIWNGNDVRVMEDFTGDRAKLAGDLNYVDGYMTGVIGARKQFDGLRKAVIMLGAIPDKKALVYFSTGQSREAIPMEELQPAIDAAVKANVAFYAIDVSGPHLLAAGDTVSLSVDGSPDFDSTVTVDSNGMISVRLIGEIKAAGLSADELQTVIARRLTPYVKTPKVTITLHK